MEQPYLTDNEVAKRYRVSRYTIWRWHRENPDFPRAVKIMVGTTRWRLSDLEAWEKAQLESAA